MWRLQKADNNLHLKPLSGVFNILSDKPCTNSSVNTIAEYFILKTAVYQWETKNEQTSKQSRQHAIIPIKHFGHFNTVSTKTPLNKEQEKFGTHSNIEGELWIWCLLRGYDELYASTDFLWCSKHFEGSCLTLRWLTWTWFV